MPKKKGIAYKSRHNIGRRRAAERVWSYKESEIAGNISFGNVTLFEASRNTESVKGDERVVKSDGKSLAKQHAAKSELNRVKNTKQSEVSSINAQQNERVKRGGPSPSTSSSSSPICVRAKRIACLNANAIVSILYEKDDSQKTSASSSNSCTSEELTEIKADVKTSKQDSKRLNVEPQNEKVLSKPKCLSRSKRDDAIMKLSKATLKRKARSSKLKKSEDKQPSVKLGKRMASLNAKAILSVMSEEPVKRVKPDVSPSKVSEPCSVPTTTVQPTISTCQPIFTPEAIGDEKEEQWTGLKNIHDMMQTIGESNDVKPTITFLPVTTTTAVVSIQTTVTVHTVVSSPSKTNNSTPCVTTAALPPCSTVTSVRDMTDTRTYPHQTPQPHTVPAMNYTLFPQSTNNVRYDMFIPRACPDKPAPVFNNFPKPQQTYNMQTARLCLPPTNMMGYNLPTEVFPPPPPPPAISYHPRMESTNVSVQSTKVDAVEQYQNRCAEVTSPAGTVCSMETNGQSIAPPADNSQVVFGSGHLGCTHDRAHSSSPMGNICMYPYPHSKALVAAESCPAFAVSPAPLHYQTVMSYPSQYSSAFNVTSNASDNNNYYVGYPQDYNNYYERLPASADPCFVPLASSHTSSRPQVKVLVHNDAISKNRRTDIQKGDVYANTHQKAPLTSNKPMSEQATVVQKEKVIMVDDEKSFQPINSSNETSKPDVICVNKVPTMCADKKHGCEKKYLTVIKQQDKHSQSSKMQRCPQSVNSTKHTMNANKIDVRKPETDLFTVKKNNCKNAQKKMDSEIAQKKLQVQEASAIENKKCVAPIVECSKTGRTMNTCEERTKSPPPAKQKQASTASRTNESKTAEKMKSAEPLYTKRVHDSAKTKRKSTDSVASTINGVQPKHSTHGSGSKLECKKKNGDIEKVCKAEEMDCKQRDDIMVAKRTKSEVKIKSTGDAVSCKKKGDTLNVEAKKISDVKRKSTGDASCKKKGELNVGAKKIKSEMKIKSTGDDSGCKNKGDKLKVEAKKIKSEVKRKSTGDDSGCKNKGNKLKVEAKKIKSEVKIKSTCYDSGCKNKGDKLKVEARKIKSEVKRKSTGDDSGCKKKGDKLKVEVKKISEVKRKSTGDVNKETGKKRPKLLEVNRLDSKSIKVRRVSNSKSLKNSVSEKTHKLSSDGKKKAVKSPKVTVYKIVSPIMSRKEKRKSSEKPQKEVLKTPASITQKRASFGSKKDGMKSPEVQVPRGTKQDTAQILGRKCKSTEAGTGNMVPKRRTSRQSSASKAWSTEGEAEDRLVYKQVDGSPETHRCFNSIRHQDGDVVRVRDSVLVKSGPRKKDLPFIGKVSNFWENPDGELMMSLLWYYRPEHTDQDRLPSYVSGEVFASKHRDAIPVACIDDRCDVLTFNEYCRYKSCQRLKDQHREAPLHVVPTNAVNTCMPSLDADSESVFLCRRVYDIKLKRVLKNPLPTWRGEESIAGRRTSTGAGLSEMHLNVGMVTDKLSGFVKSVSAKECKTQPDMQKGDIGEQITVQGVSQNEAVDLSHGMSAESVAKTTVGQLPVVDEQSGTHVAHVESSAVCCDENSDDDDTLLANVDKGNKDRTMKLPSELVEKAFPNIAEVLEDLGKGSPMLGKVTPVESEASSTVVSKAQPEFNENAALAEGVTAPQIEVVVFGQNESPTSDSALPTNGLQQTMKSDMLLVESTPQNSTGTEVMVQNPDIVSFPESNSKTDYLVSTNDSVSAGDIQQHSVVDLEYINKAGSEVLDHNTDLLVHNSIDAEVMGILPGILPQESVSSEILQQGPGSSGTLQQIKSDVLPQEQASSNILQQEPVSSVILQQEAANFEVLQHEPVISIVLQQEPGSAEILPQKPVSSEFLEQQPDSSEILQQESFSTEILKQKPVSAEILQQESVSAKILEQEPVSWDILEQEPVSSEVLEQEPVNSEILEQEPVSAEVLEQESVRAKILEQEPVSSDILEQEPVSSEVLEQEPSEILAQEPVSAEVLEQESVRTEILEQEPVSSEVLEQEPVSSKVLEQEPVSSEVLEQEPVSSEVFEQEPVRSESVQLEQELVSAQIVHQESVSSEILEQESISSEVLQKEPVSSDILQQEPVSCDILQQEPVSSDILQQEPVSSDILQQKPVSSDILQQEPVSSDILQQEPVSSDILQQEPVSSDILQQEPVSCDILQQEPVSSDILQQEPVSSDILQQKP